MEWFGPGGERQRYARTAAAIPASGEHVVVHRPGQVVALDTTILPVKVRDTVFGDPVSVHLCWALDVYTHSLVAFRLTLVSDTAVDVAMLLREVMTPMRLREERDEDLQWSYPAIPAAVVEQLAGYRVAARPFFTPETVTTDHGSVYKNHHLVEAQRVLGVNILPARVMRPTDKQAVERAFGVARSLLFERLLGYQGVDVADRGVDPETDAVLTIDAMENLIAIWILRVWQNRRLGEYAPSWHPGGKHSPNTLFAAAMAQGGFSLQVPPPQLYYQLLPAHHVKIHPRRGVKIRGLWYDGPALDDQRGRPSVRGGTRKGLWVIRRDPRDRRFVYFQDPANVDVWHTLRWVGLPASGQVPSFGDARVHDMLAAAKNAGLTPQSDEELLPVLLDLLGGNTPVQQWPTQLSKQQRTGHAREVAQAEAASADRVSQPRTDNTDDEASDDAAVLRWDKRARDAQQAVDDQRRQRREHAIEHAPPPPPRLGENLRRRSLFLLTGDDTSSERPV